MSDPLSTGPLRIWSRSRTPVPRGPTPILQDSSDENLRPLFGLAESLAVQETLRPSVVRPACADVLSLDWYKELEYLRHQRHGRWVPALMEFGKHQGERLLGLGSGLGSDLVPYARNGTDIVAASPSADTLALLKRNFDLRGLGVTCLHAAPHALPIESSTIDVVCLTGLLHETDNPQALVDEVYRVLKPGGKVLAVVPARRNVDHWAKLFWLTPRAEMMHRNVTADAPVHSLLSPFVPRFKSRELFKLFHRFTESRVFQRHLRRSDVPHVWRWLPLFALERLGGRLLVFKGFKPVSAARTDAAAA